MGTMIIKFVVKSYIFKGYGNGSVGKLVDAET